MKGGVKVWDVKTGREMWSRSCEEQTNNVRYSPDGTKVAATAWNHFLLSEDGRKGAVRGDAKEVGALVIEVDSEEAWHIEDEFNGGAWGISFSPDGERLFIGDFAGNVFGYDLTKRLSVFKPLPETVNREPGRVWSISVNPTGELLATYCRMKVTVWELSSSKKILELDVSPSNEELRIRREIGDVAFDQSGTILAGGFFDGSLRFWDARPFVNRKGEPHISLAGHHPPDLSSISNDPASWPGWWQECKINVPQGMVPNPDFGKCLRVIEQKLSCQGLRIDGAKGLSAKVYADDIGPGEERRLSTWLVARGAVMTEKKSRPASAKKSSKKAAARKASGKKPKS
jgi:WD40 repeat protein